MNLTTEFYKLPLRFDPARLAEEVLQFTEEEWRPHPQGHVGNTAIPLVSLNGELNDDVRGPMRPTPFLERCPYLQQVFAALGTVIGRARLMRIAGESDATPHVDASYYWRHHVRVHIPAVTYPEVQFLCEDKAVHMAAGETWIFDSWKLHNVINPQTTPRIHVVADTVGNAHFWDKLVAGAERPFDPVNARPIPQRFVPYVPGAKVSFPLETRNFPVVMTPWEQELLAARMFADLPGDFTSAARPVIERTASLHCEWLGHWTRFGDSSEGWDSFQRTLDEYVAFLMPWEQRLTLRNGMDLVDALRQAIVRPALSPDLAQMTPSAVAAIPHIAAPIAPATGPLDQPVFIIAAPRSGSTMLFELLSRSPGFATTGGESHRLIEGIEKLHPAARGFDSNRLTEADADPATVAELHRRIEVKLPRGTNGGVHFLEKTPKNSLRIPFLRAAFPRARFIYLYRTPEENISSIMEAWRSGQFITYPELPGWEGPEWSLALIPGWRDLIGKPLAEIATRQWAEINAQILADLNDVPADCWCAVSYAEIVANPQAAAGKLCSFAGVEWMEKVQGPLPHSRYTLTPPAPDKWRKNEAEMQPFFAVAEAVAEKARSVLATAAPVAPAIAIPAASKPVEPVELASVHTSNLPELLAQLEISLLVTTYQAGRLIIVREQSGTLNTHFRTFVSPMGIAYDGARLSIGTSREVWTFVNQEDVAPKIAPANTHDAAFLPRATHFTGDIRIHEMAYVGSELWAVNTRFSCLCTFDPQHSFVPRWRPPFVTGLAPEDRCHLNGLAVDEDVVKYVTCHGAADVAGGWRENKAHGGCLLEVPSGEIVASGLSMPHSPRAHAGHLWVLESGEGTLLRIDPRTGNREEIARMPGFTRGMDFFGPYAFIGLSQVRETAVFSGLPLTERLPENERTCGVWVVDLRNGATVAFLRFESGVQEIFSIQVLAGIRHPDVITDDEELLSSSFILPEAALIEVPAALRTRKSGDAISAEPEMPLADAAAS